jgi:RimJ/RimL family protein N-acetyltransferase
VVDRDSARVWCLSGADWESGNHRTWHGVDPATERLIVNISLFAIDADHATAKVAYRVVPWKRRQGYACEALQAVTAWAFRELHLARVQLEHSVPNTASCQVAVASGYRLEGTLRSAYRTADGVRHDDHVHARLAIDPMP